MTTKNAHFPPSSRLIDATAATQGVYNRQNTRSAAAPAAVIVPRSASVVPNNTVSVETTLSFAINPVTRAVDIRQSQTQAVRKPVKELPRSLPKYCPLNLSPYSGLYQSFARTRSRSSPRNNRKSSLKKIFRFFPQ